jgi:hypothetical protein
MAYEAKLDPGHLPSAAALADAKTRLPLGLRLHWIKEWDVNTGLTAEHLTAIKRTLGARMAGCAAAYAGRSKSSGLGGVAANVS